MRVERYEGVVAAVMAGDGYGPGELKFRVILGVLVATP